MQYESGRDRSRRFSQDTLSSRRHDRIDWSRGCTALRHADGTLFGIVSICLGGFRHLIRRVDRHSPNFTGAVQRPFEIGWKKSRLIFLLKNSRSSMNPNSYKWPLQNRRLVRQFQEKIEKSIDHVAGSDESCRLYSKSSSQSRNVHGVRWSDRFSSPILVPSTKKIDSISLEGVGE